MNTPNSTNSPISPSVSPMREKRNFEQDTTIPSLQPTPIPDFFNNTITSQEVIEARNSAFENMTKMLDQFEFDQKIRIINDLRYYLHDQLQSIVIDKSTKIEADLNLFHNLKEFKL